MVSGENAVFPNALENQNAICEKWLSEQLKTILDAIKDKGLTKLDPPALSNTVYILTLACSWFTCRINMPVSDQEIKIAMQQNGLADSQEIKEQTAEIIKDIDVPSQLFDPDLVADLLAKTLNANPSINSPASPIREAQNGLLDCSVDVLRTYGTIPFVGADSALLSEFNSVQTVYWPVSNDIAIAFVQDGLHQFTVKSFNEADVMLFNNYLASDGYWDFLFASNEKEMTRIYSAFFL